MLSISKVDGGDNPADLTTKHVGTALAMKHMTAMGIRFADGRSEAAVKLHHVEIKDEWTTRRARQRQGPETVNKAITDYTCELIT